MTSDTVTDSLGRTWQLGAALGRGSWGWSRSVRDPGGREAVLKVPYGPGEPADPEVCARVSREQAEFVQDHAFGLGGGGAGRVQSPRLEATVDLGGGRVGLVTPRYATLERRLDGGLPLSEALSIVQRIASSLADANRAHGNLKPSNVWLGERGEIVLADPCTASIASHGGGLRAPDGPGRAFLPPEAEHLGKDAACHDSWALCQILWTALLRQPAAAGVDKLALATAKDKAHAAFGQEGSNPRFRGRVAERLGALLSRGLAPDRTPSPPYRFESLRELSDRLAEVVALVRPRVVDVGRLLPPATAREAVFSDPKGVVQFSVTVGGTPGVADADDLVCGLQLTDLDKKDEEGRPLRVPVDDADVDVATHPSGRLRFQFSVPAVPPGRYRLRVAFAVKDGGDEPQVATTDFEVRPPPGYVPPPPPPEAAPAALPFPRLPRVADASDPPSDPPSEPEERLTDPGPDDEPLARPIEPLPRPAPRAAAPPARPEAEEATPVGAVIRFPRPIAPPEEDDEPPTVQVRRAPLTFAQPGAGPAPAGDGAPRFQVVPEPRDDDPLDTEELLQDTGDVPLPPRSIHTAVTVPPASVPTPMAPPMSAAGPGGRSIPPPAMYEQNPATEPDDVPGGEDLPGYGGRDGGWRGTVSAALELLRRDRYLSVGVAVAACLLLVLLVVLVLKLF